jgi:diphosphomevalonate decarboxylase
MSYNPTGQKYDPSALTSGQVKWKSPSNIALVKYWGKYGDQLPQNPSISFTLDAAHTITSVGFEPKEDDDKIKLDFSFEGKSNLPFGEKIIKFLEKRKEYFPWVTQYQFTINSENSFPHSSGIASSASGMSALVMCLMDIESQLGNKKIDLTKASFLSRLASGSASRSVYPELSIWGANSSIANSTNLNAIGYEGEVNPLFSTFHDDILIVSATEKSVSSTAGHALMNDNVYAEQRYAQANANILKLIRAMKESDLDTFGEIVESEAMTLHALMMCSTPSYVLMEPATLSIIADIRAYRKETGHHVYFTLDAGPNIHLLYPDNIREEINVFVEKQLKKYCIDGNIIRDQVGKGPKKLL